MKKTILAALLACLLLLSACQQAPAESETPTPTPTQDQTAETPPVSPDPETSADPGAEAPEFPQFLPDFIRYFSFDQVEINRTPYEDREGYKDFDVYLLCDTEQLVLFRTLDTSSWTVIREEELVAIMYFEALRARDPAGNRINLAPWDEERCLVNCFFADDMAVRYWAPASVLDDALRFMQEGHAPLGTIDCEAARYYDLFWNDPGFDALLAFGDTPMSGPITDDQMAAYVITVLAYRDLYSWEEGITPELVNEMTRKHFGRVMDSFDTGVSVTLPSGNMTATGWDVMGSRHMVLDGPTEMDEYGNITGTFMLYQIDESTWIDGLMNPTYLNHAREHMLTGDDSEYDFPSRLSVTFRIESEEVNGVWQEYLVYDAMRTIDWP